MKSKILLLAGLFTGLFSFGQTTTTFNFTGAVQTYTVPPCVYSIDITAKGAKGGGTNGGAGATVTGTIAVTPGQVLEVYVGGMGGCPAAGYNGGGAGATSSTVGNESCGGGGASDVRISPYALADRQIVAAGGGGMGGGTTDAMAGTGGCASGTNGTSPFGQGGFGATTTAGGAGGPPWISSGNPGQPGVVGVGGAGGSDPCYNLGPGGGGGGGLYGGGGGGSDCFASAPLGGGGGGGGSSLTPAGGTCTAANNNTNGQVTITANGAGAPVTFSPAAPSMCTGQSVQIIATGGLTYSWSPATGLNSTTNDTIVASPAATQTYTVTYTTTGGCTDSTTITVTVNPYPVLTLGPAAPTICAGASVGLTASGASSYTWSPATGLSATTGANVNANPGATQSYIVTGTTAGCSTQDTITVNVNPLPVVTYSPANPAFCYGQSVTVTASGAATYNWSPSTGLSTTTGPTVTANPGITTTYTVTATSAQGCTNTSTVTVTVNPLPGVNAGADQLVCPGNSVQLNGASPVGITYSWSPSASLNNPSVLNPLASPDSTTTYTLTVTDANGCTNSDQVTVVVPVVTAGFTANPTTGEPPLNVTFTNTSSANATGYTWIYGDGNAEATTSTTTQNSYGDVGSYIVTMIATDANGCSDTATMTIVVDFPFNILIPNVFSPNGDGSNDVFEVVSTGVKELIVAIYDRWGSLMYEYNDVNGKWDGKRNGKECPDGVYYYIIQATDKKGEITKYNGSLTLLRIK